MSRLHLLIVIPVFLFLAALDFVPMPCPARMIFPLLWLTLCALQQRQWALTAALFFSFLGDVMGWQHELVPQIGFFALAQVLYIIILWHLLPPKQEPLPPHFWKSHTRLIHLALLACVYGVAMCWIFPRVEDSMIRYGIAFYALLLLGMCFAALQHRSVCLGLGAILFVVSDFTLGVHLFVERVPHSTECIMIPYYLGQLLLYAGCIRLASSVEGK